MRWRLLAGVVVGGLVFPPAGLAALDSVPLPNTLTRVATLTGGVYSDSLGFGPVATSGSTIAAGFQTALFAPAPPLVLVYSEPSSGWRDAAPQAVLMPPAAGGQISGPSAVTGDAVFAGLYDPTGSSGTAVYDEPAGGWAGVLTPSAMLPTVAGVGFAADGGTVVSGNEVFSEPAGGWTGTPSPVATLAGASGPVAISGNTIVAIRDAFDANVYREPDGGWSGVVAPTAVLRVSETAESIAISGQTVVIGGAGPLTETSNITAFVFDLPATFRQTAPVISPIAERTAAADVGNGQGPEVAISPSQLAMSEVTLGEPDCGCPAAVYSESAPLGTNWSGTWTVPPSIQLANDATGAVAVSGTTLATGALDGVEVFNATIPPSIRQMSLNQLATHPLLTVYPTSGTSQITSVKVALPRALRFVRNGGLLRHAVQLFNANARSVTLRHGILDVTIATPVDTFKLIVRGGAIVASRALHRQAQHDLERQLRAPRSRPVTIPLVGSATITTTSGASTHLTLDFSASPQ